jgi:CheY-like chemotaxis protein
MDLQMPVMDGFQATATIRSDTRFATLPIVAMTAHATIEERQRCLAAGMSDHIPRVDPETVRDGGRFTHRGSAARPIWTQALRAPASTGRRLRAASIAGLDTKDGLARVGGNRKLY